MFRFANASAFFWLWLVVILLILFIWSSNRSKKNLQSALSIKHLAFLTASLSLSRRRWKWFIRMLVFIFLAIVLARPQSGLRKMEVKSKGVEVMFLVDVSSSMMAEDVRPNRLEQAKGDLTRFLDLMPGNRAGIVAFAGSAVVLSPLTNDANGLKMFIESLAPESVSQQGTYFAEALSAAEQAFARGGEEDDLNYKTTRVILILSDGEDQESGAIAIAKKLTEKGIRIFSLAYGTEKGAPVPERDHMGVLKGYKKDSSDQMVLSQVHGDMLRQLSESGGGSFFHASFGGNHLNQLVEDMNKLEKSEFDSKSSTQYDEKYQPLLFVAILLALFELLLGERRNQFRIWQGRFEVAKE